MKLIKQFLFLFLSVCIYGCSSTSKAPVYGGSDNYNIPSRFNINKLKGKKELYIVFSKNKEGVPLSIIDITSNHVESLKYFENASAIEKKDCISITENNNATVCDENKWFEYGKNDKTKLTTRKIKNDLSPKSAINAVLGTAITPIATATDILNFDPSLRKTRNHITDTYTDPIQDVDELNIAKNNIISLIYKQYLESKNKAMTNIDNAIAFSKQYPKDDFSSIIDSNLSIAIQNRSHKNIFKLLIELPASLEQEEEGVNALRSFNSFNGFATAFDLSRNIDDAKKAQTFAKSENDKIKVEYMAIKLFKEKKSIGDLFDINIDVNGKEIKRDKGQSYFGLIFSKSTDSGLMDFLCSVNVTAKKKLGIFKYGTYDVSVKTTLKIPVRYYRRSHWLSNADENILNEYVENRTLRLKGSDFITNTTIAFKDIRTAYLDRGIMGGITEIVMNGDPIIDIEVTNVSLVE